MGCVTYKKGYKYQIDKEYSVIISIKPDNAINSDFIMLSKVGEITIKKGYAWDGPSGPTFDTLNFMRGSLVHDALYQLMRERKLDKETYRETADKILQEICIADGMSSARAWVVYQGVRMGGDAAASAGNINPVIKAPKSCQ